MLQQTVKGSLLGKKNDMYVKKILIDPAVNANNLLHFYLCITTWIKIYFIL